MRHTHRILVTVAAASLVLLASACGASGGSDSATTDPTTTDAATTTTTAADGTDADAQARADSVTLELSDFPDGWESTPADDAEADEKSPLSSCDPALGDRTVQLARHSTDDFSIGSLDAGDGVTVTARTVVFEDAAAAEAAVAPFTDPDVIACIDEALKSAYSSGGQDVTVEGTLAPDDVSFDVDETVALSATYTVSSASDGSTAEVNFGVLVLRTGDIATNLLIQTVDPEFDPTTLPVDTLVDELNAAA